MKLILAIVAALCGITLAAVGPKECTKGPEYWCRDLKTAKSCGAVKHCIQTVWQNMKNPVDDTEICTECKKMVQEARDQLLSNETQEEIKEVLEGTCHIYFPIKTLAAECIKFVDEYIPELVEMLASRMDPQTVCATAGLCNAAATKLKTFANSLGRRVSTPTDCQDCKTFFSDVEDDLKRASKEEVENRILSLCDNVPQFAQACKNLVTSNFDQIYNFLINELNPDDACQLVGMCDETSHPQMKSLIELYLEEKSDVECEFCESVVQHLKDMITTNTTEEELKEVLLGFCKNLGSLDQECENFVNQNFDLIFKFITEELDPTQICTALGLCPGTRKTPLSLILPSQNTEETNDVNSTPFSIARESVAVKVPLSKINPQIDMAYHQLPESRLFPQSLLAPQSKPACALCEFALHELQEKLQDNKTSEAIKHWVENVCTLLPNTLQDECRSFIEVYGDAILVLLAQEFDPSTVCTALKLCSGVVVPPHVQTKFPMSKLTPAVEMQTSKAISDACDTCKVVMEALKTILSDNKTKEAIEQALASVCSLVPKSYQTRCKDFVDEYVDTLINMLQDTDPDQVCALLGLCAKTPEVKCNICQLIVGDVAKLLDDEDFEHDIAKVLETVCYVVPKSVRDQCRTMIDTYGPYIAQLIGSLADPKSICQEISLCSSTRGHVHLLGGKKCTYGPAYWCKNEANAKACQATEHCKKFVWKN